MEGERGGNRGFPKIRGAVLGVPIIITVIVFGFTIGEAIKSWSKVLQAWASYIERLVPGIGGQKHHSRLLQRGFAASVA